MFMPNLSKIVQTQKEDKIKREVREALFAGRGAGYKYSIVT